MELWIENNFMLELLTCDMTADYLNFMKPDGYASFLTAAAANVSDAACH